MKTIRLLIVLLLISVCAGAAWAQNTLYGTPEVLRLPPTQTSPWTPQPAAVAPSGPMISSPSPAYGAASVPVPQPSQVQPAGYALQSEPGPAADGRTNMVDSIVAESESYGPAACAPPCGEVGSCGPVESCGPVCEPVCECPWFASAGFLTLGRDKGNRVWTTYNSDHLPWQLTNTNDIPMDWGYGGEVRFGRRFCGCDCATWGIEAVYWTMKPVDGEIFTESTTGSQHVSSPLDFDYTQFDGVGSGSDYFDDAGEHRLSRRNEFHNIELNLLRGGMACNYIPSWNVQWCVGVRFFRFDEGLRFGSIQPGFEWGEDPDHEAYLNDRIKNNLLGFQIGFDARSNCWHGLQMYLAPKIGIYNNYIENQFSLYRGDGVNAVSLGELGEIVGYYPVHATDNVFSVLTEVDLGLYWHVNQNWSAKVGYRLIAATSIGLADNQLIHYVNDIPEIDHIKTNGDLLLHGAYAGVAYNY
ncbi:MAG TPA: BBP7 family outer membrane beta-barrel protein [Thermoguttaceae bacterium]|nr:BBP7 family outer membrane beta-barrel protein [Thermoguttaceae bacterium]